MNNISNISELQEEIRRLHAKAEAEKSRINNDIAEIREEFRPRKIIGNFLSDLTGVQADKQNLVKNGIAFALSILFRRYFFKAEKNIEDKIYNAVESLFEHIRTFIRSFVKSDEDAEHKPES